LHTISIATAKRKKTPCQERRRVSAGQSAQNGQARLRFAWPMLASAPLWIAGSEVSVEPGVQGRAFAKSLPPACCVESVGSKEPKPCPWNEVVGG
jgi:hypothetical protein